MTDKQTLSVDRLIAYSRVLNSKTIASGVYLIYNPMSRMIYVGSSMELWQRVCSHKSKIRNNSHPCPGIRGDANLYGPDSFEYYVVDCLPIPDARIMEFAITSAIDPSRLYNLNKGPFGIPESYYSDFLRSIADGKKRYVSYPASEWVENKRMDQQKSFMHGTVLSVFQQSQEQTHNTDAMDMDSNYEPITALQLADSIGISRQAMEKRVQRRLPGISPAMSTLLSESQINILSNSRFGNPVKKMRTGGVRQKQIEALVSAGMSSAKPKPSTKPAGPKTEEKSVPPAKTKEPWYVIAPQIIITLASIFLTIAGLLVFAKWAGVGLGIMFSMFLFSAVMIARDNMKGATSEQALLTVLRLEIGAAVLHCFTFWRLLPEFPEQFQPARVMACVALAAFAAYLSYSAVLTVRNYNAEVPDENNVNS